MSSSSQHFTAAMMRRESAALCAGGAGLGGPEITRALHIGGKPLDVAGLKALREAAAAYIRAHAAPATVANGCVGVPGKSFAQVLTDIGLPVLSNQEALDLLGSRLQRRKAADERKAGGGRGKGGAAEAAEKDDAAADEADDAAEAASPGEAAAGAVGPSAAEADKDGAAAAAAPASSVALDPDLTYVRIHGARSADRDVTVGAALKLLLAIDAQLLLGAAAATGGGAKASSSSSSLLTVAIPSSAAYNTAVNSSKPLHSAFPLPWGVYRSMEHIAVERCAQQYLDDAATVIPVVRAASDAQEAWAAFFKAYRKQQAAAERGAAQNDDDEETGGKGSRRPRASPEERAAQQKKSLLVKKGFSARSEETATTATDSPSAATEPSLGTKLAWHDDAVLTAVYLFLCSEGPATYELLATGALPLDARVDSSTETRSQQERDESPWSVEHDDWNKAMPLARAALIRFTLSAGLHGVVKALPLGPTNPCSHIRIPPFNSKVFPLATVLDKAFAHPSATNILRIAAYAASGYKTARECVKCKVFDLLADVLYKRPGEVDAVNACLAVAKAIGGQVRFMDAEIFGFAVQNHVHHPATAAAAWAMLGTLESVPVDTSTGVAVQISYKSIVAAIDVVLRAGNPVSLRGRPVGQSLAAAADGHDGDANHRGAASSSATPCLDTVAGALVVIWGHIDSLSETPRNIAAKLASQDTIHSLLHLIALSRHASRLPLWNVYAESIQTNAVKIIVAVFSRWANFDGSRGELPAARQSRRGGGGNRDVDDVDTGSTILVSQAILQRMWPLLDATKFAEETVAHIALMLTKFFALVPPHVASSAVELIEQSYCTLRLSAPADAVCITDFLSMASTVDSRAAKVLVALATQDHHADGAWSVAAIETIRSSALNVTSDAEDAQLSRADAQAAPTEGIAKTVEFGASVAVILTAALTQAEAQTLPLVFSCARAVLKRFDGVHGKLIAHGAFSGLLLRLENWLSGEESLDDSPNEINPSFLQGHGVSVPLSLPAGAMVLVDMLTRQHIIDAPAAVASTAASAAAASVVGGAVTPGAESATSNAGSAAAEDTHARVHELAVMLGWAFHPDSPFAHGSGSVSGSAASPWILDERKAGTITVAQHRAHLQGQLLSALTNVLSAGTSLAAFEAAAKEDLTQAHLLSAHKRIDRSHHKALEKLLRGIGVDESKFPAAAATTSAGAGGKGAAEKEGKAPVAGGKAAAIAAASADGSSQGRFANPFEALRAGGAATSSKNGATGPASNGAKSGSSAAALKLSDAAVKAQNKALLAAGFSLVTTTSDRRKAAKTKQAATDVSGAAGSHKDSRSTLRSAAEGTRRRRDDDYDDEGAGYRLSHDAAGDDIVEYRRTVGPGGRTSVKAASARQSEHSRTAAATSSTTTKSKHHHDEEETDEAAAPTSGGVVVQQQGDTTITQVAGVTIRQRTALPVTLAPHLMAPPPPPAPATAVAARPERGAKGAKRGGKDDASKPATTTAPTPPAASAETFSWAGRARLTIQREEEERQRRIDEEIAAKEAVRRAARQEVETQYHAARAATREDEKAVRGRLRADLDAGYDRIRARDRERAVEEEKKKIEMLKKMTSGSRNTSSTSPPAATAPPASSASSKLTEMFRKILPGSATINGEPQQQQQHVGGAAPVVPAAHGGTASQHPHARGGAAAHHATAGDTSTATHARSAPGGSRGLFGRAEASPPPATTTSAATPAVVAPPPPVVAPTAVQPASQAAHSAPAAAAGPTGLLPSWHTAQDYSSAQTAYRQQQTQPTTSTTTAAGAVPTATDSSYQVNEKQLKQMLERYYQTAQSPAAAGSIPGGAAPTAGFGQPPSTAATASMYQQPLGAGAYGAAPTPVTGGYGGTPAAPWAATAQQQQHHSGGAAGFGGGAQTTTAAGSSAAATAAAAHQQQQLMQAYYQQQQQQAAYAAAALYGSQGVSGGVQQASHGGGYGQSAAQGQPSQYHGGHQQSQRSAAVGAAPHHHGAAPPSHHPHHAQHSTQQHYPQHGYGGTSQPQQHAMSYGGGATTAGQYGQQHVPQQQLHRGGAAPGAASGGYGAPGAMYGGGAQAGAFTGAAGTWSTPAASGAAGGLSHGYGSGGMWSGMAGGVHGGSPQGGAPPQGGGYAPPQQQQQQQSQQGFGGTFGGYQGGYGGR